MQASLSSISSEKKKTCMEATQELGGVTLIAQHSSLPSAKMNWNQKKESSRSTSQHFRSYNESTESVDSLTSSMEYLSRSWSPSSSDFLHSFPSSQISSPLYSDKMRRDSEDEQEEENKLSSRRIPNKRNTDRMDLNHIKGWLKLGKSLPSMLRSRQEKKKEENRFYAAKLHAALSLTQLAAAMSSFSPTETKTMTSAKEEADMGVAFSSAAALMTAIFAESAESLGARKAQVASAINSGLAIRSPFDMIAITATTATSLRGVEALKSRFMGKDQDFYFPRSQELLRVGAQICIVMPSGQTECKWVTIYLKHKEIIMNIKKKYLGGALTTSKEYKAINIIGENKKDEGYSFVRLKTNKGIMKLLFEDEKQFTTWKSAIFSLLNTPKCIN